MHKIGVLIDRQTRKYVSDYLEGMTVPEECEIVYSIPEDGLFDPVYDDETGTWVNGLSQEEIDAIRNAPRDPSEIEVLGQALVEKEIEVLTLGQALAALELRVLQLEQGGGTP